MNKINGKDNVPFYENESSYKINGIISLAGCSLIFLASVLNWKTFYLKTDKVERSGISILKSVINAFKGMFQRDLNNKIVDTHITLSGILPVIMMAVFYAVLIFIIFAGLKDNILKEDFFVNKKKIIRLAALVILVVLVALLVNSVSFKNTISQYENSLSSWNSHIEAAIKNKAPGAEDMKCKLIPGIGVWFFWIGIALYFISIAGNFILDTLNEE